MAKFELGISKSATKSISFTFSLRSKRCFFLLILKIRAQKHSYKKYATKTSKQNIFERMKDFFN